MKDVPKKEQALYIEEIIQRFNQQKYYSFEELNVLAEKQLALLAERLNFLAEEGDIEKVTVCNILKSLRWKKDSLIERVAEDPIWQNPKGECLPICPVINDSVIGASLLMKLIVNNGNIGRSFVPPEKIKNDDTVKEKKYYWIVDARVDTFCDCSFLTVAEVLAYALHNPNVLKYILDPTSSRYKGARQYPKLYLSLIDEYPILYWSKNDYSADEKEILRPTCSIRLIH